MHAWLLVGRVGCIGAPLPRRGRKDATAAVLGCCRMRGGRTGRFLDEGHGRSFCQGEIACVHACLGRSDGLAAKETPPVQRTVADDESVDGCSCREPGWPHLPPITPFTHVYARTHVCLFHRRNQPAHHPVHTRANTYTSVSAADHRPGRQDGGESGGDFGDFGGGEGQDGRALHPPGTHRQTRGSMCVCVERVGCESKERI